MYSNSLFAILLSCYADMYLSMDFHLYDYFEEGMDFKHVLVQMGIYPFINLIYLNFFPFNKTSKYKILYIVGWSCFATTYEWVALQTDFFRYYNWKLTYSAAIYPLLFILLQLNNHFVKFLLNLPSRNKTS